MEKNVVFPAKLELGLLDTLTCNICNIINMAKKRRCSWISWIGLYFCGLCPSHLHIVHISKGLDCPFNSSTTRTRLYHYSILIHINYIILLPYIWKQLVSFHVLLSSLFHLFLFWIPSTALKSMRWLDASNPKPHVRSCCEQWILCSWLSLQVWSPCCTSAGKVTATTSPLLAFLFFPEEISRSSLPYISPAMKTIWKPCHPHTGRTQELEFAVQDGSSHDILGKHGEILSKGEQNGLHNLKRQDTDRLFESVQVVAPHLLNRCLFHLGLRRDESQHLPSISWTCEFIVRLMLCSTWIYMVGCPQEVVPDLAWHFFNDPKLSLRILESTHFIQDLADRKGSHQFVTLELVELP